MISCRQVAKSPNKFKYEANLSGENKNQKWLRVGQVE